MKKLSMAVGCALLAATPLLAGVVFEIEVKDHDASPPTTETSEVSAEGKNLKMGIAPNKRGGRGGEMIYRGDRREMVVVDHDDKSYMVIDEEAMRQIAGQVSQAMAQMQKALENVPKDQRDLVEKMMKDRMPKQPEAGKRSANVVRNTGEKSEQNGYPCVKYEVTRDGKPVRQMWVTEWRNVDGGEDVVSAFTDMASFFEDMMDAVSSMADGMLGGALGDGNFMVDLKQLSGFPVVVSELDEEGDLESESQLRSSRRLAIDPAEFEPPAGYKRRSMFPQ